MLELPLGETPQLLNKQHKLIRRPSLVRQGPLLAQSHGWMDRWVYSSSFWRWNAKKVELVSQVFLHLRSKAGIGLPLIGIAQHWDNALHAVQADWRCHAHLLGRFGRHKITVIILGQFRTFTSWRPFGGQRHLDSLQKSTWRHRSREISQGEGQGNFESQGKRSSNKTLNRPNWDSTLTKFVEREGQVGTSPCDREPKVKLCRSSVS